MNQFPQSSLDGQEVYSSQSCALSRNIEVEPIQTIGAQNSSEMPPINRDVLTNGGVSVAVILAVSYLIRSFTSLVDAIGSKPVESE